MKIPYAALVQHMNTKGLYRIVGTPDEGFVIEATDEPAYAYRPVVMTQNSQTVFDPTDKRVWIRPAHEMEDGRFEVL